MTCQSLALVTSQSQQDTRQNESIPVFSHQAITMPKGNSKNADMYKQAVIIGYLSVLTGKICAK